MNTHQNTAHHLGNNRVDLAADGGVWQAMDYYPFGLPMATSYLPDKQRWLFGGKEMDRTAGLDLLDFEARPYDPATGRFRQPDPLSEKYHPITPYLYCAANPLIHVDPTGKIVVAISEREQSTILMTLNKEDRQYITFGSNGVLNVDLMKSHSTDSYNYNSLCYLASHLLNVNVLVDNSYVYKNNGGKIKTKDMGEIEYDDSFKDDNPINPTGPTTGESGEFGMTLLPGLGESNKNSPNENVYVVINSGLSSLGAAQAFSHEAYGHGYMYLKSGSRKAASHDFQEGCKDGNITLITRIINSVLETIKNNND